MAELQCPLSANSRHLLVRGGKHYIVQKVQKSTEEKRRYTKRKPVKLRSADWYKKAAAVMSIRNPGCVSSPSLVPDLE